MLPFLDAMEPIGQVFPRVMGLKCIAVCIHL